MLLATQAQMKQFTEKTKDVVIIVLSIIGMHYTEIPPSKTKS